ncbi:MAG: hypothetical protein ABSF28_07620 [Terracidiphilus sp.]|jgi:hypothetical protein
MGHQDRTQDIKAGRLLELIREKPTLYLGETSLTGLWHFLRGYRMAEGDHGIDDVIQLPTDFLDWVAYRLHYYESTSGWRRMILGRVPNERAALMRFYELLDDHRSRKSHVVATILGCPVGYKTWKQGQDFSEAIYKVMPESMALIAYTDDPGLFLTSESDDQFPGKDQLFYPKLRGINMEMITVVDQDAFNRWLAEDPRAGSSAKPFEE